MIQGEEARFWYQENWNSRRSVQDGEVSRLSRPKVAGCSYALVALGLRGVGNWYEPTALYKRETTDHAR